MYQAYFGLTERPFSIAPDPQYLYMSSRHKEAMAHLSYGLTQGGCFIVLTGEVGTGKTTLCRNLLAELPDNLDVALILNANIN
ncbi:MAG: general secretion pathway protein A, partial [Arenicella sp.]